MSWPGGGRTIRPSRAALAVVVAAVLLVTALAVGGPPGREPATATPTPTPAGDTASPLDALHERGVDGEGVSVGVVDVTGYDTGHADLRGRVAGTAAFGADDAGSGGRYTHGTAAATTVAAVAPEAELHLATATTPTDFRRAVRWLVERDVDVVVTPVSFYGQPDDGTSGVAAAAARAADEGVVFVAPAGNLARSHWRGVDGNASRMDHEDPRRLDDDEAAHLMDGEDDRRTVRFTDLDRTGGNATRNYLRGNESRLVLWLSWDRAHRDANFSALLYREDAAGIHLVARSRPYRDDAAPNERITATLEPNGRYFVALRGPDRTTNATLELESPTHRLARADARGSIAAPATARGVLAVGAYDDRQGRVAPYTSRGPTADGRPGVDVVAPAHPVAGVAGDRYAGSSLSAPYVAAVAALLSSAAPGLAPGHVEQVLEVTATDVGRPGYDFATGFGRVAPGRAARAIGAANATVANRTGRVERRSSR